MLFAYLFAIFWFAVSAWVAYLFIQIAIGIWFPDRATEKQLLIVQHPVVSLMYPILKWISPVAAVTMPIQLVVGGVRLAQLILEG
jgi:cytosine/uracil/thiamine/allantoin permease